MSHTIDASRVFLLRASVISMGHMRKIIHDPAAILPAELFPLSRCRDFYLRNF